MPQGDLIGQIQVDQIQRPDFSLVDANFSSSRGASAADGDSALSVVESPSGKKNTYAGSQLVITTDRIILNSRFDFLMLSGARGVSISSPQSIHLDSDTDVVLFGDGGTYLGIPGRGEQAGNQNVPKTKADPTVDFEYEPIPLGIKLVNLIEDLIQTIKNATIVTPVGTAYLREDTMYDLACLQARLPEILSTSVFVEGISHEEVDPAPTPPTSITEPPTTITATIINAQPGGAGTSSGGPVTKELASQPDYFETITLYNDPL